MGILSRLNTLIKSNVNDLIDHMSDPGREVDLLITEMEQSLKQARQEVQTCLASEKLAIKERDRLAAEARSWEERATRAVQMGDDNLAREALVQKGRVDAALAEAERSVREQEAYVDQLTTSLQALEQRVKEVKLRRGTLKQQARAQAGRDRAKGGSAFDEFDRISSKVDTIEAEVDIDAELRGAPERDLETDRKLRDLDQKSKVDDALAALKKKLNQ